MKVIKVIIFYTILVIMALTLFFSILSILCNFILRDYVLPTLFCSIILFFIMCIYRDSKKPYTISGLRRLLDSRIIYYRYDSLTNRIYCRLWGEFTWHLLDESYVGYCLHNNLFSYEHFKHLNDGRCRLDEFILFLDRLLINNSNR